MKEQSNAGSRDDELDYVKYHKRVYRDEIDKSICVQKKRIQNYNRFGGCNGRYTDAEQDDETLIRETQAALKNLSGNWNEKNSLQHFSIENSVFPNLFEEKNEMKTMSPITTTSAYNANESMANRDYYYLNGKPKSSGAQPSKKPRLNDGKYDFNELVVGNTVTATDKLILHSDKSEYENNSSEYRSVQSFSQNSAFHPPSSSSMFDTKKSNSFGSMSHSVYPYADSSGYSTYSSLDMNASSNSSPEREQRPFGKTFSKDDDMSTATDYKEYTTLQPAGIGSKAASVIQDVTRDGSGGVASVVVMNSMTNASVQNTTTSTSSAAAAAAAAATTASNDQTAFLERPMAAFSPASTNKGMKTILLTTKINAFCMFNRFDYVVCMCN